MSEAGRGHKNKTEPGGCSCPGQPIDALLFERANSSLWNGSSSLLPSEQPQLQYPHPWEVRPHWYDD